MNVYHAIGDDDNDDNYFTLRCNLATLLLMMMMMILMMMMLISYSTISICAHTKYMIVVIQNIRTKGKTRLLHTPHTSSHR